MRSLLQAHYEADKMRPQGADHDWLATVLYDLYCAFSEEGTNGDQDARLRAMGMPCKQVASTQEPKEEQYPPTLPNEPIQARRRRLLERIETAQMWVDAYPADKYFQDDLTELQEELRAVEGWMGLRDEPKEPAEADWDEDEPDSASDETLFQGSAKSSNPLPIDHPCHQAASWSKGESGILCPICHLYH